MVEYDQLGIFFACVIGSAFYSGAEAVLMSINVDRVKQMIEGGGDKAKALTFMAVRSNEFLSMILIGNNIVNILAAAIMTSMATRFFQSESVGIATGITTVIILIFGEILPKTFARAHAETFAYPFIRILQINYYLLYPVIKGLSWFIKSIMGNRAQLRGRIITKDDIEFMVSKAEKEKTIDSKQLELLNSILEFPKIKVKDIMVTRSRIIAIQEKYSLAEIMSVIRIAKHSRYPVMDGDLENTIGFLHAKDVAMLNTAEKSNLQIRKYLRPTFFVYEHMKIQSVFDHMNRRKLHMALVKDENGLVVGIVTLEDIVEQIMGDIQDEHDFFEEDDGVEENLIHGISVEGSISLRELSHDYDINIPLNDNYSTLAGLLLGMLGNDFPEEGQKIVWEGLSFDLIKVKDHVILEVLIRDIDGQKHLYSKKSVQERLAALSEDGKDPGDRQEQTTNMGALTLTDYQNN